MKEIGTRLKELRKHYGYKQRDIADFIDMSQSQIAKVESNERNLKLTKLQKLADLYNTPIEYILYGEGTPQLQPVFQKNKHIPLETIFKMNKIINNLREMGELHDKHYGGKQK